MNNAADLSRRLADQAEAVCSAYLPRGRRSGNYWIVGDVHGAPGQSMFIRLRGERRGKWLDAASGQNGDLLDLIRFARGLADFQATLDEARRFLRDPIVTREPESTLLERQSGTPAAAARLHALSQPITGTIAETYLRRRRITARLSWPSLRFHPTCFYRPEADGPCEEWPALLGVVTDERGKLFGLQRTWLARDGGGKAPCRNRGARWAICWAMRCGSGRRKTSWRLARELRPFFPCCRCFRQCPWRRPCPPPIFRRSSCRKASAGSTSFAKTMRQAPLRESSLASDATTPASS